MPELVAAFNIADFGRSSPRFDAKQLLALNRKILHGLDYAAVKDRLPEGADEKFWLAVRGNLDLLNEARLWWNVVSGEITPPDLPPVDAAFIKEAAKLLPAEPWSTETWKSWTISVSEATGTKGRALYQPLRLALTAEDHGPGNGRFTAADRLQTRCRPPVAHRCLAKPARLWSARQRIE